MCCTQQSTIQLAGTGTCVNVLQTAQHLVQEELVVLWCQVVICFDHLQPGQRSQQSEQRC